MNVARFQFILNQEDLDVITKGLNEFSYCVLEQHDCLQSFGYFGRSCNNDAVFAPVYPESVCDLLHAYISSSPQIEELFIVWSLVDRSASNHICVALNHCIAVILHCAVSLTNLCDHITNKILHEYWKNIIAMLQSNNVELIHSCLGLLIAISRTSKNNCSQIMQKMNFSDNVFASMIQKGKLKTTQLKTDSGTSIVVDSRVLLIILIFTLLNDADEVGVTKMIASNSIVKKIMHGLTKDAPVNVELTLNFVCRLIEHNAVIRLHIVEFVDSSALEKLFRMFNIEDATFHKVVEDFQTKFVSLCCDLLPSQSGKTVFGIKTCLANIIRLLQPQSNAHHRQVQRQILEQQPQFFTECLNIDGVSWDALISNDYISLLKHFTELSTVVAIDSKLKDNLRNSFSKWETANKQDQNSMSLSISQCIVGALVPSSFGKTEFNKILCHSHHEVVVCGFNFLKSISIRLQKILSETGVSRTLFNRVVGSQLFKTLPDLNTILELSLKLIKSDKLADIQNETPDFAMEISDDFEFNFLDTSNKRKSLLGTFSSTGESISQVHNIGLDVLALYANLFSTMNMTNNADVLKLLNDFICWPNESPLTIIKETVESIDQTTLCSIISLLRRTSYNKASWFGSRNEAQKLIQSLQNYMSLPSTPLAKLLALNVTKDSLVQSSANSLLKSVLSSSGLFEGHGFHDYELYCEAQCWSEFIKQCTIDQLPLLHLLICTSFAFNADFSCLVQKCGVVSSLTSCLLVTMTSDVALHELLKGVKVSSLNKEVIDSCHLLMKSYIDIVVQVSLNSLKYLQSVDKIIELLLERAMDKSALISIRSIVLDYITLSTFNSINNSIENKQVTLGNIANSVVDGSSKRLSTLVMNMSGSLEVPFDYIGYWIWISMLHVGTTQNITNLNVETIKMLWNTSAERIIAENMYKKSLFFHNSVVLVKGLCKFRSNDQVLTKKRKLTLNSNDKPNDLISQFCDAIWIKLHGLLKENSSTITSLLCEETANLLICGISESSFDNWAQTMLLYISQQCADNNKSTSSLWTKLTSSLVALLSTRELKVTTNLLDLCMSVYRCSQSTALRTAIQRVSPNMLHDVEQSSWNDVIEGCNSFSEAVEKFHDICQCPVTFEGHLIRKISSDFFNPCLLASLNCAQEIENRLCVKDDIKLTQNFLQSMYPHIITGSPLLRSRSKGVYQQTNNNELFLTAFVLAISDVDSCTSELSCDRLKNFAINIIVPNVKGKSSAIVSDNIEILSRSNNAALFSKWLTSYVQEYRCFENRLTMDDYLSVPLLSIVEGSIEDDLWLRSFCHLAKYYLASCTYYLTKNDIHDQNIVAMHVNRVSKLLTLEFPKALKRKSTIEKDICFQSELNKWLKCCLKFEITNITVLTSLLRLTRSWKTKEKHGCWRIIAGCDALSDVHQPYNLFNMITGHSNYFDLIKGQNDELKYNLIHLQVCLMVDVTEMNCWEEISSTVLTLTGPLWSLYRGTLSKLDNLILRFFKHLETQKGDFHLSNMMCGGKLTPGDHANLTETFLFDFLSTQMVYSTLSSYPVNRTIELQESSEVNVENVYDLVYFLPVVVSSLRNFNISIRRLANCGGLSLVMLGLGNSCHLTRSYSLSALHLVYLLLHKQTPEVDPSFRERSQLLLLMGWLKNSIVVPKNSSVDTPSVSPMLAIFLGRAVLNIMQSNHELYSVVNKYILAKPWCDQSDVPLFDFLMTQSDSQTQVSERLAILRLVRDGLISGQDHACLCRKNGYNRLLLLFNIYSSDVRIGHAILDIFDKGLTLKQAAKYLIERSELLTFVEQVVASPASKYRFRALTLLHSIIKHCSSTKDDGSHEIVKSLHILLVSFIQDCVQCETYSLEMLKQLSVCFWDFNLLLNREGSMIVDPGMLFKVGEICKCKFFDDSAQRSFVLLMNYSKPVSEFMIKNIGDCLIAWQPRRDAMSTFVADDLEIVLWASSRLLLNASSEEATRWLLSSWNIYQLQTRSSDTSLINPADIALRLCIICLTSMKSTLNCSVSLDCVNLVELLKRQSEEVPLSILHEILEWCNSTLSEHKISHFSDFNTALSNWMMDICSRTCVVEVTETIISSKPKLTTNQCDEFFLH